MPSVDTAYMELELDHPIWDRFFQVAPLVLIGTRCAAGFALRPHHRAGPLGRQNWFAFFTHRQHPTFREARRHGEFTVSYPRPDQVVFAALAAAPAEAVTATRTPPALPTCPARLVDGPLLTGAYLHLECRLEREVSDLGDSALVAGRIVAARIDPEVRRLRDRDDHDLVEAHPLLAYLAPGRFARICQSNAFPLPESGEI